VARYPDDPRPVSPYNFRPNRPFVAGGPEWAQQTRPLTSFSLMEAEFGYRGKSFTDAMTLHNFWESVDGPSGRFTFVDFNGVGLPGASTHPGVPWVSLFVFKGDGVEDTWDLPTYALAASPAPIVYENGVAKTSAITLAGSPDVTKDYNIVLAAGTDDVDRLIATATPASPIIGTISGTCRRALRRARFLNAKNPFTLNVPANYYQGPVTILEVRK